MAEASDGRDGEVRDDPGASRFELVVDGHLARLDYRREGGRLELVHTVVPDELEGRGLGGTLVRAGLDVAARDGLTLVPTCPFARRWLEGHPVEAARVSIDWPPFEG